MVGGTAVAALGEAWRTNIKIGDKATARTLLSVLTSIPGVRDADVLNACSNSPEIKENELGTPQLE